MNQFLTTPPRRTTKKNLMPRKRKGDDSDDDTPIHATSVDFSCASSSLTPIPPKSQRDRRRGTKHVHSCKVQDLAREVMELETRLRKLDICPHHALTTAATSGMVDDDRLSEAHFRMSTGRSIDNSSSSSSSGNDEGDRSSDDDACDKMTTASSSAALMSTTSTAASSVKQLRVLRADKNVPLLGHTKGNTKNNRRVIKRLQERELLQQCVALRTLMQKVLLERAAGKSVRK